MIDAVGWAGTVFLAICGVPMLVKSIVDGHARGVSLWFLIAWGLGECFLLAYVVAIHSGLILIMNYAANIALVTSIMFYKLFPRKSAPIG